MSSTMVKTVLFFLFVVIHITFVLFWVMAGGVFYVKTVYGPSLNLQTISLRDQTRLAPCKPSDATVDSLTISKHTPFQEAQSTVQIHGAAVIQSVIKKETVEAFHQYTVKANQELDQVTREEHRLHITPPHTEPAVQHVLEEVAAHPTIRPLVDELLGPSASLVRFSVLTIEEGTSTKVTDWGLRDFKTKITASSFPNVFVPEYTIVIPLQDMAEEEGAVTICPGTHSCRHSSNMTCSVRADVKKGDAFLYNSALIYEPQSHADVGHSKPNAPERVLVLLSFASSRQGTADNRSLLVGTMHALHWRMWGQTIEDLATMTRRPWRVWHAFGLFHGKRPVRPWNLLDAILQIFSKEGEVAYTISQDFNAKYFDRLVENLLYVYGFFGFIAYVSITLPIMLLLSRTSEGGLADDSIKGSEKTKTE